MYPTVYLAAEDEPGLAVGSKLIAEAPPLSVYRAENARGFGQLKRKSRNFQAMGSKGFPVLMITDLDSRACPPSMIDEWLGEPPCPGFLFRICVHEVESWLLAHAAAIATFLGVPASRVPTQPELLKDPKAKLIEIAQSSPRREIRSGLKPMGSSTIGPDYNRLLGTFVENHWDAGIAALSAPSLARTRRRLQELAINAKSHSPE